jgi:hypothetical protein
MSTTTAPRPATLTIPEASRALGFGRSLGYELAAADRFPCRIIRAGKRYMVPRVEVEKLIGVPLEQTRPDGAP